MSSPINPSDVSLTAASALDVDVSVSDVHDFAINAPPRIPVVTRDTENMDTETLRELVLQDFSEIEYWTPRLGGSRLPAPAKYIANGRLRRLIKSMTHDELSMYSPYTQMFSELSKTLEFWMNLPGDCSFEPTDEEANQYGEDRILKARAEVGDAWDQNVLGFFLSKTVHICAYMEQYTFNLLSVALHTTTKALSSESQQVNQTEILKNLIDILSRHPTSNTETVQDIVINPQDVGSLKDLKEQLDNDIILELQALKVYGKDMSDFDPKTLEDIIEKKYIWRSSPYRTKQRAYKVISAIQSEDPWSHLKKELTEDLKFIKWSDWDRPEKEESGYAMLWKKLWSYPLSFMNLDRDHPLRSDRPNCTYLYDNPERTERLARINTNSRNLIQLLSSSNT